MLLIPGVRLVSLFVFVVIGRPLPLVFGIKLADLFKNPTKSGVDRHVLRSFIVIATLVFIALWLAVAISNFESIRIIGAVASTSEQVVFSRAKNGSSEW